MRIVFSACDPLAGNCSSQKVACRKLSRSWASDGQTESYLGKDPRDTVHKVGFWSSIAQLTLSAFMRTQLIPCRLPKADSALLRSSLFHHLCRFVSSFVRWILASARESLCRGLGSRWFTERFHRNALVTHFQHGQVFCTARQLKDYAVTRCRLQQRAPQR